MSVFGKSKRHYAKKAPKTLDSILNSALNRVLTKNPGLAEKMAFKKHGYEDLVTEPDENEKAKRDMQAIIFKQALSEIQTNPELRRKLAEHKAEEILGIVSDKDGEGLEGYPGGSSISQLMDEMEQYDELRKRFSGGGSGALGGLIDKDTINGIINLLITYSKGRSTVQPVLQERMVLVTTPDGGLAEVAESKYLELYKSGQIKPVAALAAPKVEPLPSEKTESKDTGKPQETSVPSQPGIDDLLSIVSLQEIEEFLDYTPEELVERINSEMAEGVTRASLLKTLLKTVNYDQVVQYITPYKDDIQVRKYAQRLLSPEGKEWCEKVLELVKNERQG